MDGMQHKIKIAINKNSTGKIPPGDPAWGTFNDEFVNQECDMMELANWIYLGHAYAGWHEGRRCIDNFILAQHLAVDMDTGDDRSSIDVLKDHELVRLWGSMIHTTPSHTKEAPRARVIFMLDQPIFEAKRYSAAAKFVAAQFDGADVQTTDASRFFYGSKDADIHLVGEVLPLLDLRLLYKQWQARQPKSTGHQQRGHGGAQFRSDEPIAQQLEKALSKLDPWQMEYTDWVRVLMAIHREMGDAGLPLALNWAQGSPGEVERKFRSFKPSGNASGEVTAATIFKMAGGGGLVH